MKEKLALFVTVSTFAITGCDRILNAPIPKSFRGDFLLTSSPDGTFLWNKADGVVWRYTPGGVFHAIPKVTEDTLLMKLPTGEKKEIPLEEVRDLVRKGATVESDQGRSYDDLIKALDNALSPKSKPIEKNSSGNICDKSVDPLCIR